MPKPSYSGTKYEELKDVLKESGIISENTPDNAIPTVVEESLVDLKPENIRGNVKIGNVEGTIITNLSDVSLDKCDVIPYLGFSTTFFASNGVDAYGSDKTGIYHIDLTTDEKTLIYEATANWNYFYEAPDGYIYICSSSSYNTGILSLKSRVVEKIYNNGYNWRYFKRDSNDNVYTSSGNDGSTSRGVIHLSNGVATQIYTSGYKFEVFAEDDSGHVYLGSSVTNAYAGACLLLLNGIDVTVINNSCKMYYLYKMPNGKVLVSGDGMVFGFLDGTTITETDVMEYEYDGKNRYFVEFKDSKDNLYLSTSFATKGSLVMLTGTTAKLLLENFNIFSAGCYETRNGVIYCLGKEYGYPGIIKIENGEVTQINDTVQTSGTPEWFETSDGTVYVSGCSSYGSSVGTLCIKNNNVSEVTFSALDSTVGGVKKYGLTNFCEDNSGNIYCVYIGTSGDSYYGVTHIKGTVGTKILKTTDKTFTKFAKIDEGVLLTNVLVPDATSTVYLLKGCGYSTVKIKEF
jgi:hypothetical protein